MSWEPPRYDPAAHRRRMGYAPQQPYPPHPQYPPQEHAPQPGYGQAPYPPQQPYRPRRRKRRHVFMWVFLAIQVLFLIWIIAGAASHPPGPSASAQAAQQCANGGWQGLFKSQADCQQHYAVALNDASNAGKGIGIALIVVFWCVTDFLLGVTYLVVRLARRS